MRVEVPGSFRRSRGGEFCRGGCGVCALAGGGRTRAVLVPAGRVRPPPAGLDMTEAAAIPEVFATAYLNLYMEGAATPGERFLVHAGASGVGTAAIQLGRLFSNPSP